MAETKAATAAGLAVRRLEPEEEDAWQDFVSSHPGAGVEHALGWPEVFTAAYGYRPRHLVAVEGGRLVGALPLLLAPVWPWGRALVSLPFLDCAGPLAEAAEAREALLEAARDLGEREAAAYVEVRARDPIGGGAPARTDKAKVVLDLAGEAEVIWKGLDAKVRNQVRKARRSGLRLTEDNGERVAAFYRVYAHNMRDLGSPVAPRRLFEQALSRFRENARLLTVWLHDEPVAGAVWLRHRGTAYVPWASALRRRFALCPNNLLYWRAIELACEQGCARFDFGRSTVGSGPYRFKLQWGGRPEQLYWYRWRGRGDPVSVAAIPTAESAAIRLAARTWRRLPSWIANLLGPRVVARMP